MEYHSALKKNEIMPFAATWMEPRDGHTKSVRERKINIIWYHIDVEPKKMI